MKCSCKNTKWGCDWRGDNIVEFEGEVWHYNPELHWNDGTVGPGLVIIEGNLTRQKKMEKAMIKYLKEFLLPKLKEAK